MEEVEQPIVAEKSTVEAGTDQDKEEDVGEEDLVFILTN